jgi:hypothetical protein
MTTTITDKVVENYDTNALIAYLQDQKFLNLTEKHINVLREKEVAGYDFLTLEQYDLEQYGLKPGPARRISEFASQLNSQSKFYNSIYYELPACYIVI